mgnify:FL=1
MPLKEYLNLRDDPYKENKKKLDEILNRQSTKHVCKKSLGDVGPLLQGVAVVICYCQTCSDAGEGVMLHHSIRESRFQ